MKIGELKRRARARLKLYFAAAVLVCLAAHFLGAGSTFQVNTIINNNMAISQQGTQIPTPGGALSADMGTLLLVGVIVLGIMLVAAVLGIIFSVFVSNVVMVGKLGFFVKSAREGKSAGFGALFSSFRNGWYLRTVANMFLMNLFLVLWSLLFIIPGIYKSFEYALVPYILGDEPELTWSEARERSRQWMYGEKWRWFLLHFSFMGWVILLAVIGAGLARLAVSGGIFSLFLILATLPVWVGMVLLDTYVCASAAEFYEDIRERKLSHNGQVVDAAEWN